MGADYELADLSRRLRNLIRPGVVEEVDAATARVRVRLSEDLVTAFLPWLVLRAGALTVWAPPTVGEQVTVLAPAGELTLGLVLPALYRADFPPPSNDPQITLLKWDTGDFIEYDAAQQKLTLSAACGVHVIGTLVATDDVIAGAVSLKEHVHPGVLPGFALTEPPQPGASPPCDGGGPGGPGL